MKAIAAVNRKGFIGKEGKMLWRSSEDFKHFKAATMGGICIVGKTTWEVDLKKRELPGRRIIVVGTGYLTLGQALERAYFLKFLDVTKPEDCMDKIPDVWCIGGLSLYEQLMHLFTEFHLSHIDDDQEGDKQLVIPSTFKGELFEYNFLPNKN